MSAASKIPGGLDQQIESGFDLARLGAGGAKRRVPAVQAELSLDSVKVVHNDLSDADVEVVPIKSRPAANRQCRSAAGEKILGNFGRTAFEGNRALTNGKMRSARIHSQTSDGGGGAGRAEADGRAAVTPTARSVGLVTRRAFWPRVRRLDGCLGAIAMAPRLRRREERLAEKFAGRFEIRRGNFAELADWIPAASCDGVLLDLGVSSPQLDSPERGFSFQQDGPLDMRMDDRQPLTAADLVNGAGAEELARIFWEFGGERESRRFARAIVHDREQRRFETTRQLAELIERISPRARKKGASGDEGFSGAADRGER